MSGSAAPAGELARDTAAYHCRTRAGSSADDFRIELAALHEGRVVGCQGVATTDFAVTRTGETGSWLARESRDAASARPCDARCACCS